MENEYIKSPLNYIGGKYKLLSQIMPLFPDNIKVFLDLFGGGFNVGINVDADLVVYNDISAPVVDFLKYAKGHKVEELLEEIDGYIKKYKLTKENKEGYLQLREEYNTGIKNPMRFYTLLCYAFNNQIRFNKNGEYNMPFGRKRSSFNPSLRKKFIIFIEALHNKNCEFFNFSFSDLSDKGFEPYDFVYCDPPYLNSMATYNENSQWNKKNEQELLETLDFLNSKRIKFALSNNLKYHNPILNQWKEKYCVHYLNRDYGNCNYQKKDKSNDIEVLITNY